MLARRLYDACTRLAPWLILLTLRILVNESVLRGERRPSTRNERVDLRLDGLARAAPRGAVHDESVGGGGDEGGHFGGGVELLHCGRLGRGCVCERGKERGGYAMALRICNETQ